MRTTSVELCFCMEFWLHPAGIPSCCMRSRQEGLHARRLAEAARGRNTWRTLKETQRASGTIIGHISGRHHLLYYVAPSTCFHLSIKTRSHLVLRSHPLCRSADIVMITSGGRKLGEVWQEVCDGGVVALGISEKVSMRIKQTIGHVL